MPALKAILFDLDGTLLPLDNDAFAEVYLGELAKQGAAWGFEPRKLVKSIWKATGAMVKNDGSKLNVDAFWDAFKALTPEMDPAEIDRNIPRFDAFYSDPNGFHKAKITPGENPLAAEVVEAARRKAGRVILATNPIFPTTAIEARLSWIGLTPDLFDDITYYSTCRYSKPNPNYFTEILEKHGLKPEECVMVGNNVSEDILPTAALGIRNILVTDCLINEQDLPLDGYETCTFAELKDKIEALNRIETGDPYGNYFMNRSVSDIMEEFGDHRDEWRTLDKK
ncbi:MAG: HAD family hydrolase [Clostridia bacterium]|nr:HAD family hydrolase [Clostridia bacterium]